MPETSDLKDICNECELYPDCERYNHIQHPIDNCENFIPLSNTEKTDTEVSEEQNLKGLCRHCGKRSNCIIEKPETGIWHCQEYQ